MLHILQLYLCDTLEYECMDEQSAPAFLARSQIAVGQAEAQCSLALEDGVGLRRATVVVVYIYIVEGEAQLAPMVAPFEAPMVEQLVLPRPSWLNIRLNSVMTQKWRSVTSLKSWLKSMMYSLTPPSLPNIMIHSAILIHFGL